jgi:ABC-type transport system involved in cytochrome c biogenesis permease component
MNNIKNKSILLHILAILVGFGFLYISNVYIKYTILTLGILFWPTAMPYLVFGAIFTDVVFMGQNFMPLYSLTAGFLIVIRFYMKKFFR